MEVRDYLFVQKDNYKKGKEQVISLGLNKNKKTKEFFLHL